MWQTNFWTTSETACPEMACCHLIWCEVFVSLPFFSLEITHFSHKHISELDRPLICYNIALRYIYIFKLYTANKSTIYFNHECIALSLLACSKMSTAGRNWWWKHLQIAKHWVEEGLLAEPHPPTWPRGNKSGKSGCKGNGTVTGTGNPRSWQEAKSSRGGGLWQRAGAPPCDTSHIAASWLVRSGSWIHLNSLTPTHPNICFWGLFRAPSAESSAGNSLIHLDRLVLRLPTVSWLCTCTISSSSKGICFWGASSSDIY